MRIAYAGRLEAEKKSQLQLNLYNQSNSEIFPLTACYRLLIAPFS